MAECAVAGREDPFALGEDSAYRRWREIKLAGYPTKVEDLIVELRDPERLSASETQAIVALNRRANMAVYTCTRIAGDEEAQRRAVLALGRQLALRTAEDHRSRERDGLVRIELADTGGRAGYIPYTNRPIAWHTDGYYNFHGPDRAVLAMILHCARDADGGENGLLDHEIAYIRLRDQDPAHIEALCRPDAMTIPANVESNGAVRPANRGPVFFVEPRSRRLAMRYTARTRSIEWRDDPSTRAAAATLARILAEEPLILRTRLQPGMGLICNNVLHDRTGFSTAPVDGRLLYRIRYHDPIL
jgi:alpha-ketoglutarate-dependent taurine dioxygenase